MRHSDNFCRNFLVVTFYLISLLIANDIKACTIFSLIDSNTNVVGKSNAWGLKQGYLIVNNRNIKKVGFVIGKDNLIKWTSQYGSVTFNQISQEMPNGGINEKGLVVEILSSSAKYPEKDKRKAINESQWIQFQLDNYENVDQVIASETILRIHRAASNMHYFICDRFGNRATIDFKNGLFKVYKNKELIIPVLTNTPYEFLVRPDTSIGAKRSLNESKLRFNIAKELITKRQELGQGFNEAFAWEIINKCKQDINNYNVVYNLKEMTISFNDPINNDIKIIDIRSINFDCSSNTKSISFTFSKPGKVNEFFDTYTSDLNDKQIDIVYKQLSNEGRIVGIKRMMIKIFFIKKLKRIVKNLKCES